jgi:Domain of unknown function (DUF927)
MSTAAETELFLRLNFPFENPRYDQFYKCVSTIFPDRKNPGGRGICLNRAVQSFDDTVRLIETQSRYRQTEVYMALGLGKMAKTETYQDGYAKAIRTAQNMVSLNSLYCDVDVGKNGCYATSADAELGLKQFLEASGMPMQTMMVRSGGGGFHIYWCTAEPMAAADWQPLADALRACAQQYGFKIDPGITIDSARILRVPGTLNYKYDPPRQVTVDFTQSSLQQYTAGELTAVLSQYMTVQRSKTGTGQSAGPAPNASAWAQNFGANVNERSYPKLTIDEIAVNCPMTEQTLADGGAGKDQPQWSDDMFLAAWTSDPHDAAHRLSKGHATYDPADTDRKLAEKIAAIGTGKGWPSCKSFKHAACQTCPLLRWDRSPIFFAHTITKIDQPTTAKYAIDPLMPSGYWRNENDHIITSTELGHVDVLGYPILDGGIDPVTGDLVLKTSIGGNERWHAIQLTKLTPAGVCEALLKGTRTGIVVGRNVKQQTIAKDFVMAWVQQLQETKRTIKAHNMGWHGNDFVFGDEKYTPNGPESVYRGGADDTYKRVGELQPWIDGMPMVYGSTALEIMVASAFAAPLVEMTCDNSLILSFYSTQSGRGKTTAMKLAQAVWGPPREGMSAFDDTPNFTTEKVSTLKNLPLYWDELKTKQQMEDAVTLVFGVAQGRSKGRLSRDSKPKKIGTSTTLFALASNFGIADEVIRKTGGTEAGGVRVFELEVQPIANKLPNSEALTIALNDNYGVAGAIFADFIVRHKTQVRQILTAVSEQLEQDCQFDKPERYWKHCMVTVLAGAHIANAINLTSFDISAMQAYMAETLYGMRNSAQAETYSGVKDVLGEMLADCRNRNLLVTDIVPTSAGRPPHVTAVAPFAPDRWGDVWLQYGSVDGRVLARMKPFEEWLAKHGYKSSKQVIRELEKQGHTVIVRRAAIGTGVVGFDVLQSRMRCYDITPLVPPNHIPSSPSASFGSP